jgi:hypothetical protein
MSYAISRGLIFAIASAPLLIACGGGKADNPSSIPTNQCSGSSCGVQGPPVQGANGALCPANADIGKSTYLGGAGSGEVVMLNIDAVKMTYTLKFLESPIPLTAGEVDTTRAGLQVSGAVAHPPAGTLPNAEQTRCAFMLTPATGTASDGSTYTTAFTPTNPPMVFVGQGVAGGGIPGATISFGGLFGQGAINSRTFDFYPFLGFASTTTDLSKLAGTYNGLLYHTQPTAQFAARAINTIETFDAGGRCIASANPAPAAGQPSATGCLTTGAQWTSNPGGYFDSTSAPQIQNQFAGVPVLTPTGESAKAHMILGQVNGATVPVVVRTGDVHTTGGLGALKIDDESGIAMLAAATPLASGGFDGGYVGADSNFKYTASLIQGGIGTFINPTTAAAESGFGLQYGLPSPGLVGAGDQLGHTGFAIATGGLYAIYINGTENGGVTATSANANTSGTPYFGIGAQISK